MFYSQAQYDEAREALAFEALSAEEAIAHNLARWDGPRCSHGTPMGTSLDLICDACEVEDDLAAQLADLHARLDRGEPHDFPIGPPSPPRPVVDDDLLF